MATPDIPVEKPVFSPRGVVATLLLLTLLSLGVYWGKAYYDDWRDRSARELAFSAQTLAVNGDRDAAFQELVRAYQRRPKNPEVWRVLARLLSAWDDPDYQKAHYFWTQLTLTDSATQEDRWRLGVTAAAVGRLDEAREILDSVPPRQRQQRWPLELAAALLRADGKALEADRTLREALRRDPGDPECLVRLAVMDLGAPFEEERTQAAELLWKLARAGGYSVGPAMEALSSQADLTPDSAAELRNLMGKQNGLPQRVRLAVLRAYLKRHPREKRQVIQEEMQRFPAMTERDGLRFLIWLAKLGEHERLLAIIKKENALHSSELCPIYLDSLAALQRWRQLQRELHPSTPLPLSQLEYSLLQARCSRGLGESENLVEASLQDASREAIASHDPLQLDRVASAAESFGYRELAVGCLQGIADTSPYEIPALERIYALHLQGGNAIEALHTVQRILSTHPGLHPYVTTEIYLKLLLGLEIETSTSHLERFDETEKLRGLRDFLNALGAYRRADLTQARAAALVVRPGSLTTGQRAVLAGILHTCGVVDQAFAIAEKVPEYLLLDEERKFLRKAL